MPIGNAFCMIANMTTRQNCRLRLEGKTCLTCQCVARNQLRVLSVSDQSDGSEECGRGELETFANKRSVNMIIPMLYYIHMEVKFI